MPVLLEELVLIQNTTQQQHESQQYRRKYIHVAALNIVGLRGHVHSLVSMCSSPASLCWCRVLDRGPLFAQISAATVRAAAFAALMCALADRGPQRQRSCHACFR